MKIIRLQISFAIMSIFFTSQINSRELICNKVLINTFEKNIDYATEFNCTDGTQFGYSTLKLEKLLNNGWQVKSISHDVFVIKDKAMTSLYIVLESLKK